MDRKVDKSDPPPEGAGPAAVPAKGGGASADRTRRVPGRGGPGALDYIFLLRPMILIPVWTFFLLGYRHGVSSVGSGGAPQGRMMAGMISFTALLGAVYVINQISDRETDLAGNKLFLVSRSIIGVPQAWTCAALLAAASLAAGYFLMSGPFLAILAASLLLGLMYSIEPVRLKRRAVLDIAANAVGSGVLNTLAGWTASGAPVRDYAVLVPYPLAVASVHMVTALADMEADRASGLKTSGVLAGRTAGFFIAASLMAGAAAAALACGNRPALAAAAVSLVSLIAAARTVMNDPRPGRILLPATVAVTAFALAAGFFFPPFIPALAAVIIATRIYYSRRFGIKYPSF